ncbi:MAG TPA: hypothetical protein VIL42_04575 [Sphingomicrobium sp.]|jgi:hypothetical protein
MNDTIGTGGALRNIPWRVIGWGGAVVLLSLPFFAMQFTDSGVDWSVGDFIFAGVMFAIIGGLLELGVRISKNWTYRIALALALLGSLLTIWVNLAVGIVGSEDNPNNMLFFIAVLMGVGGAIGAKLRADGMARASLTTAAVMVIAFLIAELGPRDEPMVRPVVEAVGTSIFVMLFLGSAWLFRRAARQIA